MVRGKEKMNKNVKKKKKSLFEWNFSYIYKIHKISRVISLAFSSLLFGDKQYNKMI